MFGRTNLLKTNRCLPFFPSRQSIKLWVNATKIKPSAQVNVMKKVMKLKPKKTKYFFSETLKPTQPFHHDGNSEKRQPRRVAVLNKLFMKNISDVMSTQSIADNLGGKAFEITRVEVSPDYHNVNVFWHSAAEESEEINDILMKEASNIRHELTQLRLMGMMPKISFIKDTRYSRLTEMDKIFSIADCGDHSFDEPGTIQEDLFPKMTNNVFGLDHLRIMEKIMQAKMRSLALHRNNSGRYIIEEK